MNIILEVILPSHYYDIAIVGEKKKAKAQEKKEEEKKASTPTFQFEFGQTCPKAKKEKEEKLIKRSGWLRVRRKKIQSLLLEINEYCKDDTTTSFAMESFINGHTALCLKHAPARGDITSLKDDIFTGAVDRTAFKYIYWVSQAMGLINDYVQTDSAYKINIWLKKNVAQDIIVKIYLEIMGYVKYLTPKKFDETKSILHTLK